MFIYSIFTNINVFILNKYCDILKQNIYNLKVYNILHCTIILYYIIKYYIL